MTAEFVVTGPCAQCEPIGSHSYSLTKRPMQFFKDIRLPSVGSISI